MKFYLFYTFCTKNYVNIEQNISQQCRKGNIGGFPQGICDCTAD